jgi:Na+/H+-dicarboxylate symporter
VVLASINLNVDIVPLLACEWILDRIRTAVNVYSHCVCTIMTNELFKNDKKFENGDLVKYSNGCVSTDNCVKTNLKPINEEAPEFIEKL